MDACARDVGWGAGTLGSIDWNATQEEPAGKGSLEFKVKGLGVSG